jgi:hypothetical protein
MMKIKAGKRKRGWTESIGPRGFFLMMGDSVQARGEH